MITRLRVMRYEVPICHMLKEKRNSFFFPIKILTHTTVFIRELTVVGNAIVVGIILVDVYKIQRIVKF